MKRTSQSNPPPELALRAAAVAHLTEQLARTARLTSRCEELASAKRGDRIAALNAASRLMRADTGLLAQLARVAQIESVHRTIVDKFAGLTPHGAYSNSNFYRGGPENEEKLRAALARSILGRVEASRRQHGDAVAASS